MKQIPNIFTLLNLVAGCLAIMYSFQYGLTISTDVGGDNLVVIPEKIFFASICIGVAAIIDFLDGLVARLLGASSEMGKQLDSLADVVSFGVAPSCIAYQFLRLSYAQQTDGLDISTLWLMPAFLMAAAGAYRLARFNIDDAQGITGFKGVPIPAAGLLIASFPLIYWYSDNDMIIQILINKWFWYAVILVVSYLMVSTLPMLAFKFSSVTFRKLLPFLGLALLAALVGLFFGWLAAPVTFIAYVLVSLLFKQSHT